MIQYIIAAGIGAFLGSQSKKSKKSYAHGGEVMLDELYELTQKEQEVELSDTESKRYMDIVEYMQRNDIEIPFGVEYAHGGEVDYGEIRERLQSLDLPTDAGDRTELVEEINLRYGIVCSEVIRASSDDDIYIAVDGLLRDYGVYAERGDDYAKGGKTRKKVKK